MAATKAAPGAAAPTIEKRPEPVAPFKAHKHGVRAHGTVSRVGESHRTSKHVQVTIRHSGPKKENEFHDFDGGHETQITMPAHLAKRFPHGKAVTVHVMPRGGASDPAEPKGPEVDADDARGESNAGAVAPTGPISRAFHSAKGGKKK